MQYPRLEEALDQAVLNGLLRFDEDKSLMHVPFSLSPCPILKEDLHLMQNLTEPFSEMMLRVSRDREFLRQILEPLAVSDPFLEMLLGMSVPEQTQNLQMLVQRNDFFLNGLSHSGENLRQVELNTIAASFPYLIERLMQIQRMHFGSDPVLQQSLVANAPLEMIVDGMAEAIQCYGKSESYMLTVNQPGEANRFDQLGIEQLLWEKHGIQCMRKTLEEIGQKAFLRQGHLVLENNTVALVYYRAGYTPDDFINPDSRKGRELIENSSAIQTPDLWMQLAGMKKIQQTLTRPEILSRYAPAVWKERMASTFVRMHALEDEIKDFGECKTALEQALADPESWVLKPQREGGGNNFFGREMEDLLKKMNATQYSSYILMERIQAPAHPAWLIAHGQSEHTECVSEIGRYGVLIANQGKILRNQDCGYLVRTKSADVNEGGVCAGYSCLNTLILDDEDPS